MTDRCTFPHCECQWDWSDQLMNGPCPRLQSSEPQATDMTINKNSETQRASVERKPDTTDWAYLSNWNRLSRRLKATEVIDAITRLQAENAALRRENHGLGERLAKSRRTISNQSERCLAAYDERDKYRHALKFYADPETYFACSFVFDPPTGGFDGDFEPFDGDFQPCSEDHPDRRDRPGKLARAALTAALGDDVCKTCGGKKTVPGRYYPFDGDDRYLRPCPDCGTETIGEAFERQKVPAVHPSHDTRSSDASSFDAICKKCGATDRKGSNLLSQPCSGTGKVGG